MITMKDIERDLDARDRSLDGDFFLLEEGFHRNERHSSVATVAGDELPASEFHMASSGTRGRPGTRSERHSHCRRCRRNRNKTNEGQKAGAHRRSATKRGAIGRGESISKLALYGIQEGLCYLCGTPTTLPGMEIEHVIPLSRGGTHHPRQRPTRLRRLQPPEGSADPGGIPCPRDAVAGNSA